MVCELYLNKATTMVLKERGPLYTELSRGEGVNRQQTNRTNQNFTEEKVLQGKQDRVMCQR